MRKWVAALLAALLTLSAACTAEAQLLLTGVGGPGGAAAAGFSVTYGNSYDTNAANDGSFQYTTSALAIGAANAHRLVCTAIAVVYATNQHITAVTIGGVSATGIVTDTTGTLTRTQDFYCAVVPTGTTAVIVITSTGASSRMGLDYWMILNAAGDTYNARSGAVPTQGTTTTTPAVTIATANGIVVAAARFGTSGAIAWTQSAGTTGTKNSDHAIGASLQISAYTDPAATTGSVTYTATGTTSALGRGLAVSFEP